MSKIVTRLYLIRHAQALGNVNLTFQGHSDEPLTDKGKLQIERLCERMKEVKLDAVYASPLIRAHETAQALAASHGLSVTVTPSLKELNGGEYEGRHWQELAKIDPQFIPVWEKTPHLFHAPGGESMPELYERIGAAIHEIAKRGGDIAVISHGCSMRNYLCRALGYEHDQLATVPLSDNTGISLIEYDESFSPHVVYINDAKHLGELADSRFLNR